MSSVVTAELAGYTPPLEWRTAQSDSAGALTPLSRVDSDLLEQGL